MGPAVLPVVLTVAAFAVGVLIGWLWWGRRFFTARLTRDEALSLVRGRIELDLVQKDAELAEKDALITRLRAELSRIAP